MQGFVSLVFGKHLAFVGTVSVRSTKLSASGVMQINTPRWYTFTVPLNQPEMHLVALVEH